jgi:prepilin-type N-terminal cleavage/methylation domain-containing protein
MNKRGTSLVELIAVIAIMGVIASIATFTVIAVIDRQRKNATINALDNIYGTAKEMLYLVGNADYDDNIVVNDDMSFCYISFNTMIDEGVIDGKDYRISNGDILFCYNMSETWATIGTDNISSTKPTSTGTVIVNNVSVTFNYSKNRFASA